MESESLLPMSAYRAMERLDVEIIGPAAFPEDVFLRIRGNRPDGAIVDAALNEYDRKAVLGMLHRTHVRFVQAGWETTCKRDQGCFLLSSVEAI